MQLEYRRAVKNHADLLINIYNSAFYDDYIRYGECPAYGRTRENTQLNGIYERNTHIKNMIGQIRKAEGWSK